MQTKMKKKCFIYIFFLVPILCASCDWVNESDKQESKEVKTIEVFPDSVRQYLIEQDSLKRGLISKIDTLTTELNASKKEIEQLQSEIKELKSPGRILIVFALCALLLSILAIILSIIRTSKKVNRWEVKDMTRQMVREQIKDLDYRMTRAEGNIKGIWKGSTSAQTTSAQTTSANSPIDKRILDLDVRLSRIERSNSAESSNYFSYEKPISTNTTTINEAEINRKEYAKANSGKFLVQITDSQQEGCVYVINCINKEEGKFDIISLAKIKPVNDIMDVVELVPGSCSLEDATNYKVIEKGLCKKVEGKPAWEVTKKLKIKVTK